MKLRTKYFLLLLIASLVPMIVVTTISQKASKKLGKSISSQVQKELDESVKREIVFATENYALITRNAKSFMEFALHALKGQTGSILKEPLPHPAKVYFAKDFEDPQKAPDDLAPSLYHKEILKNGRVKKKQVSYQHPNFLLAPGVNPENVKSDIQRLTLLSPALKGIAEELGDHLFWIYASLESGVHILYPGHGGYPSNYDPRKRPWYIRAKKQGALIWGEPIVDATTNQLTFTVSAPFYDKNGKFAGVAALDVLIHNVLLKNQISSQWSKNMKSFLVDQSDYSGDGKKELWILSQNIQTQIVEDSTSHDTSDNIENHKDFEKLLPHLNKEKSGSIEMAYQGIDSLWAFAEIFPDLHFVIIAPKSIVTGLSKEVGYSFSSYSFGQAAISIVVIIIVIIVVAILALFISRANNRKMMSIVKSLKQLEQGDFSVKINLKFSDERNLIVTTLNQTIPKLEEHLRMSQALGLAKDVQQSLLPKKNPELKGFDISGKSVYCEETGGDYYDFIPVHEDRLAVVVGDVSGHGVSSSLLMATARALIMLRASMPGPAANIINDVNRHLSLDTYDTGNFMTFFYCELSTTENMVNWVRAGHDPAIIYDSDSDTFEELKGTGLAFGVDDNFEYEEFQQSLKSHQTILIGTDGIWEMRNEMDEMYGKQRLMEVMRREASNTSEILIKAILDSLEKFRGSKDPEDDVTMVVIKVK